MSEQSANIKFVQEVEKYPVLYNYNLPGYSRRDDVEQAWNEVAYTAKLTVSECKEKWRNLRTVFARRMKTPLSGAGKQKRAYYLADKMQFTIPFIKTLPSCSENLPEVPDNSQDSQELVEDDADGCTLDAPLPSPPESLSSVKGEHDEKEQIESPKKPTKVLTRKQKAEMQADHAISSYFNAKKARLDRTEVQHVDDKKESIKMFLLSLLPELMAFSTPQLRNFKQQVLHTIDTISTPIISSPSPSSP